MENQHPKADETFRRRFKETRERVGLSQVEVAQAMQEAGFDFHQQTVYKVETGQRRITIGEAVELSRIVRASVEKLLARSDPMTPVHEDADRARHQALLAADNYTVALLRVAVTADALETDPAVNLTDADLARIVASLSRTPARVAAENYDRAGQVWADFGRGEPTPHVKRLLDLLATERAALEAADSSADHWIDYADGQPEPSSRKASNG